MRFHLSLREIHCGIVDGMPADKVQQRFPDLWKRNLEQTDPNFRWPGGESHCEFRVRVLRIIRRIAAIHAGAKAAVFTHAGVISQLTGWLRGESPARWKRYRPGNASITEIRWTGERSELIGFDERAHLEERLRT